MRRLLQISVLLFCTTFLLISCDSNRPVPGPNNSEIEPVESHSDGDVVQPDLSPDLRKTLAQVRRATARYHDVTVAEESGYVQVSPFVPGMGYHYLKESLMDDEVIPTKPEALVYVDNPADESKRRLVAVEYLIPEGLVGQQSDLDGKFPGVDGDAWHHEHEIHAWTLHAWIWYPNPEGVFHPANSRVKSGQN